MRVGSDYTDGRWFVSADAAEIVPPATMDDWADNGWVSESDDDDGSVNVTLPNWTCTVRYYPSTSDGLRLADV